MTNDKVCTENDNTTSIKRKSRIHKGIERTLNTAKFESIVIHDYIDEEIEWTTLEERDKKVNNWEGLLINRFKVFHDKVMNELRLEHKVAYFKESEPDYRAEPGKTNELDDLDSLG